MGIDKGLHEFISLLSLKLVDKAVEEKQKEIMSV